MTRKNRPRAPRPLNQLRIIGGDWRGRKLSFPDLPGLRPTPDRLRETLFNWLQPWVPGARCLDLFAGSGALGLEALSRGADHATFVEQAPAAAAQLRANLALLGAQDCKVAAGSLPGWLQQPPERPWDLVFLDPPYRQGLLSDCCALLESQGYLATDAAIYLEAEQELGVPRVPSNWTLHREKRAGQVASYLFLRGDAG
ncbi:16S rRNA (guanine(966)-N(2))-methyltransferase RsmD [Motiliproteus sp. SC1-56]|uniref:16S rRNA (guanine(966)-N(2))-methyltransferase RsmD n=1 Tax=Motiliproteus sp. SC1-56 TaxID=2799565 RepID=UPI001A8EB072|nr:16S rRNA (guanine(966)-N(2))-methyltransferase RsmD [Motiliproteus sp. SC1-56]